MSKVREVYIVGKDGDDYAVNVYDRKGDHLDMVTIGAILPAKFLPVYQAKENYKVIFVNN